jgi:peptidoglycan/LPS O-acetylase OafA/YrhL
VLARLVAASALALVCCGVYFGTLHLGWGAGSLIGGAARVSFGFGTGLLLHRCRALLPVMGRRAAWVVLAALVYLMALPLVAIGWTLAVVLLCLPAVLVIAVAAGQHAVLPGGAFLGRLSYPLYATHLPLIALIALIAGMLKYVGVAQGWPMLVLVPLLLAVAYRVLVGLDEPVRAWLARRFLRQVPQGAGGAIQPERDCGESRQAADRGWESPVSGEPGIARQHAAELKTGSELNLSLREETATAGYAPGGLQVV